MESTPQHQDQPSQLQASQGQPKTDLELQRHAKVIAEKAYIAQKLKEQGKDSAHNSNEEDAEEREDREDNADQEAQKQPIQYTPLGSEDCPVTPDMEEVEYSMSFRIPKIEGLEQCPNLMRLGLRKNLITKIEGLDKNPKLEELELYDNRIRHIENISHLTNLVILDLSFNRIKEIQGINTFVNLRKLYLSANRIRKIENLEGLSQLIVLDVGDNKIRKIENVGHLDKLTEFYAAKNKLTSLDGLQELTELTLIACQANFIQDLTGLSTLVNLEQLYLQQNQVKKFEGLENNKKLETLDLAMNKLERFENLDHLGSTLHELWLNWNNLVDDEDNRNYLGKFEALETLYLADNPLANHSEYQQMVAKALPKLRQLDGNQLLVGQKFYHQRTEGIHPASSMKSVNPQAQQLIQEVLDQANSK